MKLTTKLFVTIGVCITAIYSTALSATAYAQSNSLNYNKVYQIGIENGYYPYEYYNDQGQFVGYDVDVINLVCKNLGIKCQLQKGQFESLIPNLLYRKTDMVISDLSITKDRKKVVNFSNSYVPAQGAVYIVNDRNKNLRPQDLTIIGVEQGTTLEKYLKIQDTNNKYRIVTYPSFDTAILDLKAGRVQAVFESIDTSAKYRLNPVNKVTTIGNPVYSPILSMGTGIAFRKQDNYLREQVNRVLNQLENDGTLKALRIKYGIEIDPKAIKVAN